MSPLLRPRVLGNWLPQPAKDLLGPHAELIVLGAGTVVVVLLLVLLLRAFGGAKKPGGSERGLQENLAEYPPPPGPPGPRRLLVEGLPVRLRLVVVAPGRQADQRGRRGGRVAARTRASAGSQPYPRKTGRASGSGRRS